jgi:hypothetical protein
MNSKKIQNLLDPASAQDASTKAYVDSSVSTKASSASVTALTTRVSTVEALKVQIQAYEKFTLGAGDLSSITVSAAIKGTPWVMREGIMGRPGTDFTFSGSTITFVGQWIHPSGVSSVEEGDEIFVFYMKEVSAF